MSDSIMPPTGGQVTAGPDTVPLTVAVFAANELPRAYVDDWRRLARSRSPGSNPFLSYQYVRAVAESRPFVNVAVVHRGESALGYLPFQFSTWFHERLKVAEPPGADMAGYFGITGRSDCVIEPERLLKLCGLNYMRIEQLEQSQSAHGLTAERAIIGRMVKLNGGGEHYWTEARQRDPKFVADTERRQRQLVAVSGALKFSFSTVDASVLDQLIERKRAQYRRTHVMDALGAPWRRRLLHRLAESRDPDCTGVLSTLYAGSTWVASHFGLMSAGTLYFCFPVYNPDLSRYAPGRLLEKAIIDTAGETGVSVIDHCGGDTQAKRYFANFEHTFYRGAWYRPELAAFCYRAGCSMFWRVSGLRDKVLGPIFRGAR